MGGLDFSSFMGKVHGLQKYADPRTRNWFLLEGSPVPVWIITALYLFVVTYIGPKFMKNRKPYNPTNFMIAYNIGLVILSTYIFIEILLSTTAAGYGWFCAPYNKDTSKNPLEMRVANVLWIYTVSKVIEFMDTVLMVIRKKQNQVTFLHLFHHASILNIWWWVQTFLPGGQAWFSACLNSLVHIVMYSYYGLCLIPSLKEHLWWKRYITTFQLVQFVMILYHTVQTYTSGCDFPLWGQIMLTGYMISLLILFGNFYIQSYIKKGSAASKKPDAAGDAEIQKQNGGSYQNGALTSNGPKLEADTVKRRH